MAAVVALTALDAVWGADRVITAALLLGPLLAALSARPRATAYVGALAVAATLLSFVWNDNFGDIAYVVRVAVVGAGTAFAVIGAGARRRMETDNERFRLLRAAAELGDRTATVDETVRRVNELLVPALADVCVIDVIRDGGTERLAVAAHGAAPDDLSGLDAAHRVTVDLRARGRQFGALTLALTGASGRRFDADDAAFVRVLAGRVALALDNAGLSTEVEALSARLTAALGSLAEAVTIQDASGRLVYANQAAAEALGYERPEDLLATPPERIVQAFESFLADGSPLRLEALPGRRVLAGLEPEPLLIRSIHRETGEERWRVTKATAVRDREGRPYLAVNVFEDVTEVKRAELNQRFLAAAGEVLASSLDTEETLARVAQLAVPELADWCSVAMPDEQGYLRSVAVAHSDPAKVRLAQEYNRRYAQHVTDRGGSAQVLREGTTQVVNGITDEMLRQAVPDPAQLEVVRSIGMRAAMVVPMTTASGVIGVITFASAESGRPFTANDREIAEELGRRAGAAVENARLYSERARIAQTLQMSLLPDELPVVPGFELAALYRPAGEETFVGGDFYDALATDRGWVVVVGDVTGRGAEAAALTAQARHTLRTATLLLGDPVAALEHLNRALAARPDLPICTVAVVLLAESEGGGTVAHVTCAGHPQPLLVRGGEVRPVGAFGAMVGAWDEVRWQSDPVALEPGDVLVLYTDGVIDAVGADGRFGEERLAETLRGTADAEAAVTGVREALAAFERGEQADDTAVVALAYTGPSAARRAPGGGSPRSRRSPASRA